eukprot:1608088-Prymnesium_polylepis.1
MSPEAVSGRYARPAVPLAPHEIRVDERTEGDHATGLGPATRPKATCEKPKATGYVASVE